MQMITQAKEAQEHRLQQYLCDEECRMCEVVDVIEKLGKTFFPASPLPALVEKLPPVVFEIVASERNITDDSADFSSTGIDSYSYVTPWNSRQECGFYRTILDFRHQIILEEDEVKTSLFHFETPVFTHSVETVDTADCIAFRPEDRPSSVERLYRDKDGIICVLGESDVAEHSNSLMHVGEVPWKVTKTTVDHGYVGVHFQNLHSESAQSVRYIVREDKTFFPCSIDGIFYYIVPEKNHSVKIVRFADGEVVSTFFAGGKPLKVISCVRFVVIVLASIDDGLIDTVTIAAAPY